MLVSRVIRAATLTLVASVLLIASIIRLLPPRERAQTPAAELALEGIVSPAILSSASLEPSAGASLTQDQTSPRPHTDRETSPDRQHCVAEEEYGDIVALIPPHPTPAPQLPPVEMPRRAALPVLPDWVPPARPLRPEAIRIPRVQKLDEQALMRQLRSIPEISLYTSFTVAQAQQAARQGAIPRSLTEPPPLLEQVGLNPLRGEACKLSEPDAIHLQEKSVMLRELLNRSLNPSSSLRTTNDPFDSTSALSDSLFRGSSSKQWLASESVPVLVQMLMAENTQRRKILIEALSRIPSPRATVALAQRACFDLDPERRLQAVQALAKRPSEEYLGVLMAALRYPWQPITLHAAEALAALQRKEVIPGLLQMLDHPDPAAPYKKPGRKGLWVREMVRINHFRGCLLCHPPSFHRDDLVRGNVPTTDTALPSGPQYYAPQALLVTARVTYLRQDFSLPQIVSDPGKWPEQQRFDFLTRERPVTPEEKQRVLEGQLTRSNEPAIIHALRFLTKEDAGPRAEDWKKHFLNREVSAQVRLRGLKDARSVVVDEVGTVLVAERERILRLPPQGALSEWYYAVAPIRDLSLDRRGAVWLALEHSPALHRVDLKTQVRSMPAAPPSSLHQPSRLASDKHRGMYIVQGDGKLKYQNAANLISSVPLGKLAVQAVALNHEGNHLYLVAGKELWRALVIEPGQVAPPQRLWNFQAAITTLAVDDREVLVVGTADGVQYFSPEGLTLGQTPLGEPVVDLAVRGSLAHVLTATQLFSIELAAVSRP
ncbi:MAG: HEAT repeat domain-containing protein [Gemmataceae bacterium]